MTDCDDEENNTLTEWLSQYKETIIQSIRKDAMTFIEILKGDSKFLDENIRKDIDSLTRTPRLSCKGMCRYYTIILTKTTSNKGTSTEYILHDKETPTACVLQDKKTDNKPLTYCILHNTIIERIQSNNESPPECILEDKETMTEGSPQDKETMTEGSLQDKETMTQGSIQDKETMTASTTHIRALFEPGCPSALNITTTKIELKWEEPSIGTDFIHFYQIICEEQSSSWTCLFETPKHACNYVVKGLKPNAEDLLEPGCPSALDITSTQVELKWEELSKGTDFIHFYQIFCEEQSSSRRYLFETPRNDCNFVVEGLKPNTKYAFKIQAVKNGQNKGPVSKALTVTTLEISCDRMAEFLYVLFYIAVLIWFTYLFCYSLTAT
ncbi:unnamed protein product [Mytilus edulis]|uniref:Fibronectin type-III domain-containing protein n=1 Tax=Mytilus edulis TaxID=6550 RepID=A0A8S3VFC0_MYTED|nr:unnamed protein product [Mytilus edulis]